MSDYQPQRYAYEGGLTPGHTALVSPWASYIDVEPNQWRRLYDWLLPPNRTNTDLFVLHDHGQLLTVNPIYAKEKLNIPEQIINPNELAQRLHEQWQRGTVIILERSHYQTWLDDIQRDTWIAGDDLLAYGLKIKDHALHHAADEGIVLYPSPLTAWKDIPPEFLLRLGFALAPDKQQCSVVLAVYDGAEIWTSLILAIQEGQVQLVTTLPADALASNSSNWRDDYSRLIPLVEDMAGPIKLGIFCERQTIEKLGITPIHWSGWMNAQKRGELISIPASLDSFIASI